ncbi:hypothetical protein WA158_001469 [Blastocystis sp. Blastoise]
MENSQIISVAPMLDVTDTYQRFIYRLITKCTTLYTEMIVDTTVIYQQQKGLDLILNYNKSEHPIVAQIGGSQPGVIAAAAKIINTWNYDEFNINCGCPSFKVSKNEFGARLMLKPELVASIIKEMKNDVSKPITIKCRIGVDNHDSYEELCQFIAVTHREGCTDYIIHARKCLLHGLTTNENRYIPELKYEWVFKLLDDFPDCTFSLNGGISSIEQAQQLFKQKSATGRTLKGIMIGRAVMGNPWILRHVDSTFYHMPDPLYHRAKILLEYDQYCKKLRQFYGRRMGADTLLIRPLLHLFAGERGGVAFRRTLQDDIHDKYTLHNAISRGLQYIDDVNLFTIDNNSEELIGREEEIRYYRDYFKPVDFLDDEYNYDEWGTSTELASELETGDINEGVFIDMNTLQSDEKGNKKREERGKRKYISNNDSLKDQEKKESININSKEEEKQKENNNKSEIVLNNSSEYIEEP